ncbi:MAG: hypothetical protein H7Z42_03540, partial [Roseiflexaceae bacterium]|nr:hypothetical protein [Roseiflexaceae bacterium]
LSAGPTERNYSDEAVLAELNYPLDFNINYLNGWLVAHGKQPFATKRLPGPRDWLFASRAYAQLGLEWPEHAAQIKPERQAALDAVGRDLEQAMKNISTRLTADGPQGNAPLFTEVISNYTRHLGAFDVGLQATQATFVQEQANQRERSTPFDLYGGVEQQLQYRPTDMTNITCAGLRGEASVPAPHNLKNIIPNYNQIALSDYLNVNKVYVCYGGEWTDIRRMCARCSLSAILRVFIQVGFGDSRGFIRVATRSIYAAEREVMESQQPLPRAVAGWEQAPFYKAQFEEQFVNATPAALPPAEASQLAAKISDLENALVGLQQTFDARVKSEMNGGSLKDDTVALAGGKKLLESFVALGMPQALESDDLLRSLLYGNQSLVDDQQVIAAYTRPISTTQLTINPRLELMATATKRHEALGELLTRYTDAINAESYSEPISLINNTRLQMNLSMTLAGIDAGAPPVPGGPDVPGTPDTPGSQRFFLPFVGL